MDFNFNHLNEQNFKTSIKRWVKEVADNGFGDYKTFYMGSIIIGRIKAEVAVVKGIIDSSYFIVKFRKADDRNDNLPFGEPHSIRLSCFEDNGINIFGKGSDGTDLFTLTYEQFKEMFCSFFKSAIVMAEQNRIRLSDFLIFDNEVQTSFFTLAEDTEYNWFGD